MRRVIKNRSSTTGSPKGGDMTKIYEDDDRVIYTDKDKESIIERDKETGDAQFHREIKPEEWSTFESTSADNDDDE
jgi:hypothetical protein